MSLANNNRNMSATNADESQYLSPADFVRMGYTSSTVYPAFAKLKQSDKSSIPYIYQDNDEQQASHDRGKGQKIALLEKHADLFITLYKLKKQEYLRRKTVQDLSPADFAADGYSRDSVEHAFRKLEKEWEKYETLLKQAEENGTNTPEEPPIRTEKVENSMGQSVRTIPLDCKTLFVERYKPGKEGDFRKKTDKDVSVHDMEDRGYERGSVYNLFVMLEKEAEKHQKDPDNNSMPPIIVEKVRHDKQGHLTRIIPEEKVEFFITNYHPSKIDRNAKHKTIHHLSVKDLIKKGYSHNSTYDAFEKLQKEWEEYEEDNNNPCPPIPLEKVKPATGSLVRVIHKQDEKAFIKRYDIKISEELDKKTDQELAAKDFVQKGYNVKNVNNAFTELEKSWNAHNEDESNPKPSIALKWVRHGKGPAFRTISIEHEELFITEYELEKAPDLREKTDDDLSRNDFVAMGYASRSIRNAFEKIEEEWEKYNTDPDNLPRPPISIEMVEQKIGPAVQVIPKKETQTFLALYNPQKEKDLQKKEQNQLSILDMGKRGLPIGAVTKAFEKLKEEWRIYGEDLTLPRPSIPLMEVKQKSGPPVFVILADHEEDFMATYNLKKLKEKTENDLSIEDFVQKGFGRPNIERLFKKIKTEWEDYNDHPDEKNEPLVRVYEVKGKSGSTTWAISAQKEGEFIQHYQPAREKILRNKADQDMSVEDFVAEGFPAYNVRQIFSSLKKEMEAHESDPRNNPPPLYRVEEVRGKHNAVTPIVTPNQDVFVSATAQDQPDGTNKLYVFSQNYNINKTEGLNKFHIFSKHYNLKKVEKENLGQYLSIRDFIGKGYTGGSVRKSFNTLIKEWKIYLEDTNNNEMPSIPLEKTAGKLKPFSVIPKEFEEEFVSRYKLLKDPKQRMVTAHDITTEVLINKGFVASAVRLAFQKLNKEWEAYQEDSEKNPKPPIRIEKVNARKGLYTYAISENDEKLFLEHFQIRKLREKTSQDLSISDFVRLGFPESTIIKVFSKIRDEQDKHLADPDHVSEPVVPIEQVKNKQGNPWVVPLSKKEFIVKYYNLSETGRFKTKQDLSIEDLFQKGYSYNSLYQAFTQLEQEQEAYMENSAACPKPPVLLETVRRENGVPVRTIPKDQKSAFVTHYKLESYRKKTRNDLSVEYFSEKGYLETAVNRAFKKIDDEWHEYRCNSGKRKEPLIFMEMTRNQHGVAVRTIPRTYESIFLREFQLKPVRNKKKEDLSIEDLAEKGYSSSTISRAFKHLELEEAAYRKNSSAYHKPLLSLETVRHKGVVVRIIPKDQEDLFISRYKLQIHRKKTKDDLSIEDFAAKGYPKSLVGKAFKKIKNEWKEYYEDLTQSKDEPLLFLETVQHQQGSAVTSLPKSYESIFIKSFELKVLPRKTNANVSIKDLMKKGYSRRSLILSYKHLEQQHKSHLKNPTAYPKPSISLETVRRKDGHPIQTIPQGQENIFIEQYRLKAYREKTFEDLSLQDLVDKGYQPALIRKAFEKIRDEWKDYYSDSTVEKDEPLLFLESVRNRQGNVVRTIPNTYALILLNNSQSRSARKKIEGDLTPSDISRRGSCVTNAHDAFDKLEQEWTEYTLNSSLNSKPSVPLGLIENKRGIITRVIPVQYERVFFMKYMPEAYETLYGQNKNDLYLNRAIHTKVKREYYTFS